MYLIFDARLALILPCNRRNLKNISFVLEFFMDCLFSKLEMLLSAADVGSVVRYSFGSCLTENCPLVYCRL